MHDQPNLKQLRPHGPYSDIGQLLQLRFAARDLRLFARKQAASMLAGNVRTRFRGRGIDFEEVRVYQAGDDIRTIDWRVTARTQVPHTKLFKEERERPVYIVADQRSPMFFGSQQCFKSVLAGFVASTLAWAALANSDRIGAMVFRDRSQRDIRARRSKHAVLEFIHQLAEYSNLLQSPVPDPTGISLLQMLEDSRRIAKPGSAVFIVSDFHDGDFHTGQSRCEEQLFLLTRHTDVTLIHLYDSLEKALPSTGLFSVTDGRQRRQIACDVEQTRDNFSRHFTNRLQGLTRSCQRLGIPLVSLDTAGDPLTELRNLYGKKKRR